LTCTSALTARTGCRPVFITINKAALLKTAFVTQGGFRVAETRLRVWLTEVRGRRLQTVHDGHIKVSIARIKSGKLPGLNGILWTDRGVGGAGRPPLSRPPVSGPARR
jgi:hypothetical protein